MERDGTPKEIILAYFVVTYTSREGSGTLMYAML